MEYRSPIFPVDLSDDSDVALDRKVYQYDHGVKIQMTGLNDLPQIHYATDIMKTSIVDVPVLEGGAYVSSVPDGILTQADPIHVYVYIEDEDAGLTVKHLKLKVIPRAKPTSSEYTPAQHSAWDALVSQFNSFDDSMDMATLISAIVLARMIQDEAEFYVNQNDGTLYLNSPSDIISTNTDLEVNQVDGGLYIISS